METNRNGFQGSSQGGRQEWSEGRGREGLGRDMMGQGGMDDLGRGDLDQGRMQFGSRDQGEGRMGQVGQGRMGLGSFGQDRDYGRMGQGQFGQGQFGQGQFGQGQEQGRVGRGDQGRRTRWQREAMTARDIMTSPVRSVNAQSSIRDVAQIMKDENVGIVPVVDDGRKLVGVVTDRDLVVRALAGSDRSALDSLKVQDLMSDDVEAVAPDEELIEVIELMGKRQVRRIPVVDEDDTLLGIISLGDIANRADYDEELQDALEQISAKRSFWNRRWL